MHFLSAKKLLIRITLYFIVVVSTPLAHADSVGQDKSGVSNTNSSGARSGLFHLDGISEDVARGDLLECMAASSDAMSVYSRSAASYEYGLVGSIVGSLLGGAQTNRLRNASLQKCMVLRGYKLFLVDELTWLQILKIADPLRLKSGRDQSLIVDALAAFASKPLPDHAALQS